MNILLFGDTLFRMAAFIIQRIRERARKGHGAITMMAMMVTFPSHRKSSSMLQAMSTKWVCRFSIDHGIMVRLHILFIWYFINPNVFFCQQANRQWRKTSIHMNFEMILLFVIYTFKKGKLAFVSPKTRVGILI